VVSSTLEGRASFTEAARLLGFRNMNTLRELGVSLGVLV
jgi:predicted HTH domain antitoxin